MEGKVDRDLMQCHAVFFSMSCSGSASQLPNSGSHASSQAASGDALSQPWYLIPQSDPRSHKTIATRIGDCRT